MLSEKEKKGLQDPNHRLKYVTLTFLGFHDKKGNDFYGGFNSTKKIMIFGLPDLPETVKVETLLLQIGHKKRKDVSSPIMQAKLSQNSLTFWILSNVFNV